MHILLIGNGGREHAMAWKLAQSPRVSRVICAPGNPGMAGEPATECVDIASDDLYALLKFAKEQAVDLTIVGPEAPLVAGIVDRFTAAGLAIFGPSAAAAQLEGSKAYSKAFMNYHGIPTADFKTFTDENAALAWLEGHGVPVVIKADGLAAGKGVVVAHTLSEAREAIHGMLSGQRFGKAGNTIVLESFLTGEEASFIAVVDGSTCLALASSQDHKARDEGDRGPNTGGMGAYSPAPVVTDAIHEHIMRDIMQPTVDALKLTGTPFKGFLYAGLMIDDQGQARVIEYNVRLGDPETQPLMMRLESDLVDLCEAAIQGRLSERQVQWRPQPALAVVLAAGEYPASGSKGVPVQGVSEAQALGCQVFHAGTAERDGQLVTGGGRVLCVTALGQTIAAAKALADQGAEAINWPGRHYRRDIGYRAIAREQSQTS